MKSKNNRKTAAREQEILNPGPAKDARVDRTGNQSGLENKSMPHGRGESSSDHSQTEKQNQ